jgi:DNA (cytosine-5)-methyltransferase 1
MGRLRRHHHVLDRLLKLDNRSILERCEEILGAIYYTRAPIRVTRGSRLERINQVGRVIDRLRLTEKPAGMSAKADGMHQVISQMSPSLFSNLVTHASLCCTQDNPKCFACPLVSFCSIGVLRSTKFFEDKPVVIDLFAGAGGLSAGFRQEGFHVVMAVEKDKHAAQSYRVNNPGTPVIEADVRNLRPRDIRQAVGVRRGQIDAVIAGPPCQGFSVAGPRKPHATRNYLFRSIAEIANGLQAKLLVMENVPGLRRVQGVGFENRILAYFKKHGYCGKAIQVDASEFGVPQRRKRLIFVCARGRHDVSSFVMRRLRSRKKYTVLEALRNLPRPYTRRSEIHRRRHGRLVRNHRMMKHSARVIQKISQIAPSKGPISYRRLRPDLAHTLIAGHRAMPVHPRQNRTITTREAARIQTIPDSFQFLGPHAEQPLQVANVVPYRLARAIARNLLVSIARFSS